MELPPNRKKTPLAEVAWDGPIVSIKFAGPNIGQRETPIIQEDIGPYLKLKTIKFLVMDLTSVSFMSSMGLSMFIGARNAAAAAGARLCTAIPRVVRICEYAPGIFVNEAGERCDRCLISVKFSMTQVSIVSFNHNCMP